MIATMDKIKYFKLEILETTPGANDDEAFVKFRAWFKTVGQKLGSQREIKIPMQTLTETSHFVRVNGEWLYREAAVCDYTAHTYPAQP